MQKGMIEDRLTLWIEHSKKHQDQEEGMKLKGEDKDKTFIRGANRNITYVIELLGDLPIDEYNSKDASKFRDCLIEKGLLISSVKRVFSSIRSIINLSISGVFVNLS